MLKPIRDECPGDERPNVRLLSTILHRHRRLVSEHDLTGCDQLNDAVSEGRNQFTGAVK